MVVWEGGHGRCRKAACVVGEQEVSACVAREDEVRYGPEGMFIWRNRRAGLKTNSWGTSLRT